MASSRQLLLFFGLWSLIFTACQQASPFRPNVACEYSSDYGMIYIAHDAGKLRVYTAGWLSGDTSSFLIGSYEPTTLFYIADKHAIGFVDSNFTLHIVSFSGTEFWAVSFDQSVGFLQYDPEQGYVFGLMQGKSLIVWAYDLWNAKYVFGSRLEDFVVDTGLYYLDRLHGVYSFTAKRNDTLFLISYNYSGQMVSTRPLDFRYFDGAYNYLGGHVVARYKSKPWKLVAFYPEDESVIVEDSLEQAALLPFVYGFDAAHQAYVYPSLQLGKWYFVYVDIYSGKVIESHQAQAIELIAACSWSAFN